MSARNLLAIAGVRDALRPIAFESLAEADHLADGLLLHKLKVRYIYAKKIAELLPWEAERLIDVRPDLLAWDIEPIQHIRSYGDRIPYWHMTSEGGRPTPNLWLNPDPESDDYKDAVAHCYWCPGHHPRSREAVKAWYRRNGGAGEAYRRGLVVNPADGFTQWSGKDGSTTVKVSRAGDAWIVAAEHRMGPLTIRTRKGFEVDNVYGEAGEAPGVFRQIWFPIPGYELRAPVTWSTRPTF